MQNKEQFHVLHYAQKFQRKEEDFVYVCAHVHEKHLLYLYNDANEVLTQKNKKAVFLQQIKFKGVQEIFHHEQVFLE